MRERTRQEHLRRVELALREHQAHVRGVRSPTVAHRRFPAARPQPRVTVTPCKGRSPAWQEAIEEGDLTVARIHRPRGPVPDEEFARRQAACAACPHSHEWDGVRRCACCGCPRYSVIKLDLLNASPDWQCPRPSPAFGPVSVE